MTHIYSKKHDQFTCCCLLLIWQPKGWMDKGFHYAQCLSIACERFDWLSSIHWAPSRESSSSRAPQPLKRLTQPSLPSCSKARGNLLHFQSRLHKYSQNTKLFHLSFEAACGNIDWNVFLQTFSRNDVQLTGNPENHSAAGNDRNVPGSRFAFWQAVL